MSGYEEEHNIKPAQASNAQYRRPDLSTFFSNLSTLNPSSTAQTGPTPGDTSAIFRDYANGLQLMLSDADGAVVDAAGLPQGSNQLLQSMIGILMENADDPPSMVKGMPESYFDELERVTKTSLKADESCPICANAFLEDKYPLVVRLPCHKDHKFDLECIKPWLKVQTTCPMCRTDLQKKKEPIVEKKKAEAEEDEEEWDDMYA